MAKYTVSREAKHIRMELQWADIEADSEEQAVEMAQQVPDREWTLQDEVETWIESSTNFKATQYCEECAWDLPDCVCALPQ